MKAARSIFPSAFASDAGALSRSGPIVPVALAGLNVWHEAQPLEAKTVFPAAALPPPPEDVLVPVEVEVEVGVEVDVEDEPTVTVWTTVADGFPSEV
jgi:hypothetical protein